jgi:hypothetical protein
MKAIKSINIIFIIFFLLNLISLPIAAIDIDVDFKTTRISAKVFQDENRIETGHIVGTITNDHAESLYDTRLEMKILSAGAAPVEPEGSAYQIEIFPTKAIYYLGDLESGSTIDFDVSIEITDIEISEIIYEVLVKSKNENGTFEHIYQKNETLQVEFYSSKAVSPVHSIIIEIPSTALLTDEDSWAVTNIKIKNIGDYYENDIFAFFMVTTQYIEKGLVYNKSQINEFLDLTDKWKYTVPYTPMTAYLSLSPGEEAIVTISFDPSHWNKYDPFTDKYYSSIPIFAQVISDNFEISKYRNDVKIEFPPMEILGLHWILFIVLVIIAVVGGLGMIIASSVSVKTSVIIAVIISISSIYFIDFLKGIIIAVYLIVLIIIGFFLGYYLDIQD